MEKENWIEATLNSTNGIGKATPPPHLFSAIQQRIQNQEIASPTLIWLAAASLALLVVLNARFVFSAKHNSEKSTAENLARSISNNNQLY